MRIASEADVKAQFSALLKASEQGPVIVTRHGKPAAVLLAVRDEAEFESLTYGSVPRKSPDHHPSDARPMTLPIKPIGVALTFS
jgi:prevent-host-death family protein